MCATGSRCANAQLLRLADESEAQDQRTFSRRDGRIAQLRAGANAPARFTLRNATIAYSA